jgi:eukaryotic-like serine/threonine-protein kinase
MLTGEKPEAGPGAVTLRTRPSGVHRDLDARHDALVLSFLAQDPQARPEDAFAARRALGALKWPSTIEHAAAPATQRPKSIRPVAARLMPELDGTLVDQWLKRRVVTIPLDEGSLSRASAFARADHPALQAVLRVDREVGEIWLAAPRGKPLVGPLAEAQAAAVREAIARLHDAGQTHGALDAEHLLVDETGAVMVCFSPLPGPTATADLDRLALAQFSSSS